jgi:hypothetical protein
LCTPAEAAERVGFDRKCAAIMSAGDVTAAVTLVDCMRMIEDGESRSTAAGPPPVALNYN